MGNKELIRNQQVIIICLNLYIVFVVHTKYHVVAERRAVEISESKCMSLNPPQAALSSVSSWGVLLLAHHFKRNVLFSMAPLVDHQLSNTTWRLIPFLLTTLTLGRPSIILFWWFLEGQHGIVHKLNSQEVPSWCQPRALVVQQCFCPCRQSLCNTQDLQAYGVPLWIHGSQLCSWHFGYVHLCQILEHSSRKSFWAEQLKNLKGPFYADLCTVLYCLSPK